MSPAAREIFAEWSPPLGLTISIALTGAIYLRGWLAIRRTRPAQFGWMRLASFLSGLGVLWLAIGSPMDGFADALLSAHMVEHLLLMSAVPPLLLWGLPAVPMLRGLPKPLLRWFAGPLLRFSAVRRFGQWLVTPLIAWLALNISFIGWHIPAAYDFALRHEHWHDVEHACFLFSSLLFWWCILRPWPAEWERQSWGILFFLVSADVVNTIVSASLVFCGRPVYSFYLDQPNPFHVVPLDDQVLGAAIMWVLGSLVFLVPAMLITLRLLDGGPKRHTGSIALETIRQPSAASREPVVLAKE